MACEAEVKEYIEAVDKLWELGVNPKRALRDLAQMAEENDPKLPEAFKTWVKYHTTRGNLMRCAVRAYLGEEE